MRKSSLFWEITATDEVGRSSTGTPSFILLTLANIVFRWMSRLYIKPNKNYVFWLVPKLKSTLKRTRLKKKLGGMRKPTHYSRRTLLNTGWSKNTHTVFQLNIPYSANIFRGIHIYLILLIWR